MKATDPCDKSGGRTDGSDALGNFAPDFAVNGCQERSFPSVAFYDFMPGILTIAPAKGSSPNVRFVLSAAEAVFHLRGHLEPCCGPVLASAWGAARRLFRAAAGSFGRTADRRHIGILVEAIPVVLHLFRRGCGAVLFSSPIFRFR